MSGSLRRWLRSEGWYRVKGAIGPNGGEVRGSLGGEDGDKDLRMNRGWRTLLWCGRGSGESRMLVGNKSQTFPLSS